MPSPLAPRGRMEFDPLLVSGESDRYEGSLETFYPLGEVDHGYGHRVITDEGAVWAWFLGDEIDQVGPTIEDAIDAYLLGKRLGQVIHL